MNDLIAVIPEVRRLLLFNVGAWKSATFVFTASVNVVRGPSGSGKTTILRALLPLADEVLTTRFGSTRGTIGVEYSRREFEHDLPAMPTNDATASGLLSVGEQVFQSLDFALSRAKRGGCVLIDEEAFGSLDDQHCAQAVDLICSARCQSIVVLPFRLRPEQFAHARVFDCSCDGAGLATVQVREL